MTTAQGSPASAMTQVHRVAGLLVAEGRVLATMLARPRENASALRQQIETVVALTHLAADRSGADAALAPLRAALMEVDTMLDRSGARSARRGAPGPAAQGSVSARAPQFYMAASR